MMEGGKQLWVLTYRRLAFIGGWSSSYLAMFRRGQLPSYVCDRFHTRATVFVRGWSGDVRMLMVMDGVVMVLALVFVVVLVVVVVVVACWWYGVRKKGEGSGMTHLDVQTVTMASIVTVWTTWHIATSSPFVVGVRSCSCKWQPVLLSEAFRMDTCPKSILYQNGHFATGQIAKMTCCLRRVRQ